MVREHVLASTELLMGNFFFQRDHEQEASLPLRSRYFPYSGAYR